MIAKFFFGLSMAIGFFIGLSAIDYGTYTVTRVIDGDTIVVSSWRGEQKVRLLGVDTPETKDPSQPAQCYGKEATDYTTQLLLNQTVELRRDWSQSNKDKYNRLLRYVLLNDENVSYNIIVKGFGKEYTYDQPYMTQAVFKEAEHNAKRYKIGLWKFCNINN